jgi:putative PIN family toxin of toxin-antitoxin system
MDVRIVLDTNVLVSALLRPDTAPRQVLRLCIDRSLTPLMANALMTEYLDVLSRDDLFGNCPITAEERTDLLNALLSVSEWTQIHYLWRPNLKDEGDNHVLELAVAGRASVIVSANRRDLDHGELLFPHIRVLDAKAFLSHWRTIWRP